MWGSLLVSLTQCKEAQTTKLTPKKKKKKKKKRRRRSNGPLNEIDKVNKKN